jgi:hypothetical protein
MPRTPDRRSGPQREDDSILFEDRGSDIDSAERGLYRKGGDMYARDSVGAFNLRTGGSGLTESAHRTLRQLIHFIDDGPAEGFASGAYREILPSGNPFYTSITWWESSAKLKRIVDLTITRNGNQTPSQEQWRMFDTDGTTVLATVTDAISYSGVFETTRTRMIA